MPFQISLDGFKPLWACSRESASPRQKNPAPGAARATRGATFRSKTVLMAVMTDAERREAARLRSEGWRRAHGIGPRRPAQRPWLAEGVSRSTWYRRGNRISRVGGGPIPFLNLTRAESLAAALRRDLERCVLAHAVMARELSELWIL
jgi:hypothetical protein